MLDHLKAEVHAVVRSGQQLSPEPTGSANHGLHLQVVGFEAVMLKEFS